jgi:LysR family transcriptional activator of glutamate synthase operon
MELRQLRYVEAVARHRHFTRAAEELHVAQSALSHQVRRLEAELGTELFERTSRRVAPTQAGEAIAARARRVLAEVDGARDELDELQGVIRGKIAIGALLTAGEIDFPRLMAAFSDSYPGVEVGFREGTAGDMFEFLARDEIDVSFAMLAGDPPPGMVVEPLSEDELVAVFAPGEAPSKASVRAADLSKHRIVAPRAGSAVKTALDEFFAAAGEPLRVSLTSGEPYLLRCMVAGGFGAAVLPGSLSGREGPPVEVRSLRPRVALPIALVWREARHMSPAARAFVEFTRRQAGRG